MSFRISPVHPIATTAKKTKKRQRCHLDRACMGFFEEWCGVAAWLANLCPPEPEFRREKRRRQKDAPSVQSWPDDSRKNAAAEPSRRFGLAAAFPPPPSPARTSR